jgi:hypothetical protein
MQMPLIILLGGPLTNKTLANNAVRLGSVVLQFNLGLALVLHALIEESAHKAIISRFLPKIPKVTSI